MTDHEKLQARAAFVAKIKRDDEHRESWAKTSVKAHWTGPLGGFASDGLNRRWDDFWSGWQAAKAATPAAQPADWVGLTAKDLEEIPQSAHMGAIWADAKLREKNGGKV